MLNAEVIEGFVWDTCRAISLHPESFLDKAHAQMLRMQGSLGEADAERRTL
jgi:hypothetical protein